MLIEKAIRFAAAVLLISVSFFLVSEVFLEKEVERKIEHRIFFFFSEYCPHCKVAKPWVDLLTAKGFCVTYCNVLNMSSECMNVTKSVNLKYVPTLVIFNNETEIYVGSSEIKEKVEMLLNESK